MRFVAEGRSGTRNVDKGSGGMLPELEGEGHSERLVIVDSSILGE